MRKSYHRSQRSLELTFNAIHTPICLMNCQGKIKLCNAAMASVIQRPLEKIIGHYCYRLMHNTDGFIPHCPLVGMLKTGHGTTSTISLGQNTMEVTTDPVHDRRGRIVGGVHILNKVGEIRSDSLLFEPTPHAENTNGSDLLPVCCHCRSVRIDTNTWTPFEDLLYSRFNIKSSHGICPACVRILYPDLAADILEE